MISFSKEFIERIEKEEKDKSRKQPITQKQAEYLMSKGFSETFCKLLNRGMYDDRFSVITKAQKDFLFAKKVIVEGDKFAINEAFKKVTGEYTKEELAKDEAYKAYMESFFLSEEVFNNAVKEGYITAVTWMNYPDSISMEKNRFDFTVAQYHASKRDNFGGDKFIRQLIADLPVREAVACGLIDPPADWYENRTREHEEAIELAKSLTQEEKNLRTLGDTIYRMIHRVNPFFTYEDWENYRPNNSEEFCKNIDEIRDEPYSYCQNGVIHHYVMNNARMFKMLTSLVENDIINLDTAIALTFKTKEAYNNFLAWCERKSAEEANK